MLVFGALLAKRHCPDLTCSVPLLQGCVEIIYVLVQSILYTCVVYFMCGFLTNAGGSLVCCVALCTARRQMQPRSCLDELQSRPLKAIARLQLASIALCLENSSLTASRCVCSEVLLVRARA